VIQTVICMRWGTRYGSDYVNRLHAMVRRNTDRPLRFVCFTDDATGLEPGIEPKPLPPITLPERVRWKPWRKISLWAETLDGLDGDVLFFDVDLIVTGSIDPFFDFAPESSFCVIRNWTQPDKRIGNTSAYRFRIGAHPYLYNRLSREPKDVLARYRNSQTYISSEIREMTFWPEKWCVSFKHSLMPRWPLNFLRAPDLPPETRVVAFTGKPDPGEAWEGIWPAPWYKRWYKHVRPTPWIGEHWR
jgi:hypothetical protein